MGQVKEGTRAEWPGSMAGGTGRDLPQIPVPLLRCRVAALTGHWDTWRFTQDLPGQELPPCPAPPSTLWRASPGSGPSTQCSRSPPITRGGVCAALRDWAGRDGHIQTCRSLLSNTGWTFTEHVNCCGKEQWQGRVGAGRKERAGGVFQILYLKKNSQ